MNLLPEEVEFLTESNYIEGEDGNIEQPAKAWEYLKNRNILSHSVILKTHKILMIDKSYPPPRGYYRDIPQINVSIGGRIAPHWSMVRGLMDNWMLDYQDLGWKLAHVRFELIHPFVDGNGRIGRMLMNWQRLQEGLEILVITEDERFNYYKWFKNKA